MSLNFSSATPTPSPNLSRHGHDLSFTRQFSCMPGQLLPVFRTFLSPGDFVKLNSSTFARTEAIESSAFVQMSHHADWFAVPVIQLYRFWNEFFNGTDDFMSSFSYTKLIGDGVQQPSSNLPSIVIFHYLAAISQNIGTSNYFVSGTSESPVLTVDKFGIPNIWNASRLLDLLGYGSTSTSLDLHPSKAPSNMSTGFTNDRWNPLYFLAYHKIFHSHYQNTDYFKNDPMDYNIDKFYDGTEIPQNIAAKWISTIHYRPYRPDFFTQVQPSPFFDSNFANFLSSNPLFSETVRTPFVTQEGYSSVDLTNTELSPSATAYTHFADPNDTTDVGGIPFATNQSNIIPDSAPNSVGDLRALFALEKLSRITASTGSHYYDQTLAHFGYKIPRGISDEAIYIGSQVTPININEVVATATTISDSNQSGSLIGDIAGKGFTPSNTSHPDLDFEAPCHCVLMCISSISVDPVYASIRTQMDNRYLHTYDFFHPEFDNLGLQPFFNSVGFENIVSSTTSTSIQLGTIGWQRRWAELKTGYNIVNESMFATSKNIWVGYKQAPYEDFFSSTDSVPLEFIFYTCPQYLNNIFVNKVPFYGPDLNKRPSVTFPTTGDAWDSLQLQPNYMYAADNFLLNMRIKCFKTSVMSPTSLPKLGL